MKINNYALTYFFLFALTVVCGYRFYDYVLKKNYAVIVHTSCDPSINKCFFSDCKPEVVGCDVGPFEKVEIRAFNAPTCLLEHTCGSFTCANRDQCIITFCNDNNINEGESCIAPLNSGK